MAFATRLLGRHVGRCTQYLALQRHGNLAGIALGQAKIHDARCAVLVDHDIRRLDVPVHDAKRVSVLQGVGHGRDQAGCLAKPGPPRRQKVGQGHAVHEIAHQVGDAVLLGNPMNRDDRRVPQLGYAAGLPQKAGQVLGPSEVPRARHLERHDAVQLRVTGLVHRAEGPDANRLQDLELADLLAGAGALVGRGIPFESEARSAGRAQHLLRREPHQLDQILAVRANDVHVRTRKTRSFLKRRHCPLWSSDNQGIVRAELFELYRVPIRDLQQLNRKGPSVYALLAERPPRRWAASRIVRRRSRRASSMRSFSETGRLASIRRRARLLSRIRWRS